MRRSRNTEWPFGHLPEAKASEAARYIAKFPLENYSADFLVLRELRRYLLLRRVLMRPITMQSKLVDEAWHAFILDTRQYTKFCEAVFGEYLHHQSAHFELDPQFPMVYQELFGEKLPAVWFPPKNVAVFSTEDTNCA